MPVNDAENAENGGAALLIILSWLEAAKVDAGLMRGKGKKSAMILTSQTAKRLETEKGIPCTLANQKVICERY